MRVLINRTDALGDTLLSTPLARLIKYHHPKAQVAFLVSSRSGELIALCKGVDKVFVWDDQKAIGDKRRDLKEIFSCFPPDLYFHLGGSFLPTAYAYFKRIPFRGGLLSRPLSFLFLNKGIRQSRSKILTHESFFNMSLISSYEKSWAPCPSFGEKKRKLLSASLSLKEDLLHKIVCEDELISKLGERKLIFIHPGMSGHTLNWPGCFYGELAFRLLRDWGDRISLVISFTPSDRIYVEEMKKGLRLGELSSELNQIHEYDGSQKGLLYFSHLLSFAHLFIGPSTGTTHLANALGLPQVALYSPLRVQSAKRWGPFDQHDQCRIFSPPSQEEEEISRKRGEELMAQISVDRVYKACVDLLHFKKGDSQGKGKS